MTVMQVAPEFFRLFSLTEGCFGLINHKDSFPVLMLCQL